MNGVLLEAITMEFCNDDYFTPPEYSNTFLTARGFDTQGARSGGIIKPAQVDLKMGNVLFRFFHSSEEQYGQWWTTPRELAHLFAYFARDGAAFDTGRAHGKGILQGTLAVRHEWGQFSSDHLGKFWVARVVKPMHAFYGEGEVAPNADQSQSLRPVQIDDGTRRRNATQIFLPKLWTYKSALLEIGRGKTDTNLSSYVKAYSAQKLHFEA